MEPMKNVRVLIGGIWLLCAVVYLGDFVINGQHPFSSAGAGISLLILGILFIVIHIRDGRNNSDIK
jgi:hypothetical protein